MREIAILGASPKENRYSFKAQQMLMDHGYPVRPISPKHDVILGVKCCKSLAECPKTIDTLTLYVGPHVLEPIIQDVLDLSPRLVIFNPGTESTLAQTRFEAAGITTIDACTLVLLSTGQFERY